MGRGDDRLGAVFPPRRQPVRGGLRLEHTIPLPVGTVVNLTFTLPGDKTQIAISGEIVSAAGPEELRMGVKFIDPSPEARAQIDAFLARAGV